MLLWFMVYGLWFMVYGLWFMVYGLWCMVYGSGCTVWDEVDLVGQVDCYASPTLSSPPSTLSNFQKLHDCRSPAESTNPTALKERKAVVMHSLLHTHTHTLSLFLSHTQTWRWYQLRSSIPLPSPPAFAFRVWVSGLRFLVSVFWLGVSGLGVGI